MAQIGNEKENAKRINALSIGFICCSEMDFNSRFSANLLRHFIQLRFYIVQHFVGRSCGLCGPLMIIKYDRLRFTSAFSMCFLWVVGLSRLPNRSVFRLCDTPSRFIQIKNSINLLLELIAERLIDFAHK